MKMFSFLKKKSVRVTNTSDFSVFFREASSGEKKRVFKDVAIKASADQRRVIDSVSTTTQTAI